MNLAPLLAPVVILGTHLVLVFLGSGNHWVVEGNPVYRYPRGIAYFILIGMYAIALVLAFIPQSRAIDSHNGTLFVLGFAGFGTFEFAYFFRYQVVLERLVIRTGAFFMKEAAYADIVRARYLQGQNSGVIILYTHSGKRIFVWDTIGDFSSCAKEIDARLPQGVTIPRDGRMAFYLGNSSDELPAKVAGVAARLRARLSAKRRQSPSQ